MRILLLSAYDAASHRRWREGLAEHFPQHDWQMLTLPARHFSWRIRGNSLTWAFSERAVLERDYDLLIATSMVDLASLKGLVLALAEVTGIAHLHEILYAYPDSDRQFDSFDPQMVTLYGALAAGRCVFNSDFNRRTFLDGVASLLAKFPDAVPEGIVELLARGSTVLPVPLEDACFARESESASARLAADPLHVIWNHRWEYDKGPARLLAVVERLLDRGVDFELSVLGAQFRQHPNEFDSLKRRLEAHDGRLRHWGYIESADDYRRQLQTGDVALSTAVHDFQRLSVLEAVAAGCVPLVPDRVCYPEWFDPEFRYPSRIDDVPREAGAAADAIARLARQKSSGELPRPPSVRNLGWSALSDRYAELLRPADIRV